MRATVFGSSWWRFVSCCSLLFLLSVVLGCGPAKGKVSGRVLYDGKPLPGGRVTFRPVDSTQNSVSAELGSQGDFEAVLPVGEVMVSVDNRELEPRSAPDADLPKDLPVSTEAKKHLGSAKADRATEKSSGKYVAIPSKYYNAETSNIRFTVTAGEQKHDIELSK
jgi:hypothetical protein